MSAAARLAWRYCTLFPIQRWLGVAALVIAGLAGTAALVAIGRGSPGGVVAATAILILPVALFFFPASFVAGSMLRYWAAPSAHGVLPRLRLRVLGSVLLLTGTIAGAVWSLTVLGALAASAAASIAPPTSGAPVWAPFLIPFALVTVAVYTSFRVTAAPRSIVIDVLIAFVVIQGGLLGESPRGTALGWMILGGLLSFWTVFSIWYLRAPRIAPVDLTGQNLRGARPARLPARLDTATAAEVLLTGRAPLDLRRALPGFVLIGIGLCVLLRIVLGQPIEEAPAVVPIEGLIAIGVASSAVGFSQFASRARYLWLLGVGARANVFRRLEIVLLKYLVFLVLAAAAFVVAYHYIVSPLGPARALAAFLLAVGIGPLTAYAGLARARNVGAIEIAGWIFAMLTAVVPYFAVTYELWPWSVVAWVALAQIVAAMLLRVAARRNWRRVDWLELRAVRLGRFGPSSNLGRA